MSAHTRLAAVQDALAEAGAVVQRPDPAYISTRAAADLARREEHRLRVLREAAVPATPAYDDTDRLVRLLVVLVGSVMGLEPSGGAVSDKCAVADCGRRRAARGLCAMHYKQAWCRGTLPGTWVHPKAEKLPNPWADEAPPCPTCSETAYFWADGPLCWVCPPCRRRFDVAAEAAA